MNEFIKQQLKISFLVFLTLTVLTGLIYPILITGFCQFFFPWQANGSLIERNGKLIGSSLIGQSFTQDIYFWSRPSATENFPYNATHSAGSNIGPSNPLLLTKINEYIKRLNQASHLHAMIPVDLVTASGSGLDPDISLAAALYQAPRIALKRHLPEQQVNKLIWMHYKRRVFGLLGEQRINVLELNLALDDLTKR